MLLPVLSMIQDFASHTRNTFHILPREEITKLYNIYLSILININVALYVCHICVAKSFIRS